MIFKSQIGLFEVQKSLNLLDAHGSNFVPINPWSLLHETPKPMPVRRDFGMWFHLTIGLLSTSFLGFKLIKQYRKMPDEIIRYDLLAAMVTISFYDVYLLAFIPLDYTYRLMKIAISIFYPLMIFALPPFLLWVNFVFDQNKNKWLKKTILILLVFHMILNFYTTLARGTFPSGNLLIHDINVLKNHQHLAIVGCPQNHVSQYYERLVGLQIARHYPNLQVDVFSKIKGLTNPQDYDVLIQGTHPKEISEENNEDRNMACEFTI